MRKYTSREIIKEVPDVQTVILPNHWFDDLSDNQLVFSSLYDWMLKNGRVPSDNKKTLHNSRKQRSRVLNMERIQDSRHDPYVRTKSF